MSDKNLKIINKYCWRLCKIVTIFLFFVMVLIPRGQYVRPILNVAVLFALSSVILSFITKSPKEEIKRAIILSVVLVIFFLLMSGIFSGGITLTSCIQDGDINRIIKIVKKFDVNLKDDYGDTYLSKVFSYRLLSYNDNRWTSFEDYHKKEEAVIFKMLSILIENRADVNALDGKGMAPLHYAVTQGLVKCVHLLVESGADVNIKNKDGRTPLQFLCTNFFGCDNMFMELTDVLIKNGADINAVDKDGKTALKLVKESGFVQMTEILRSYGAKE